MGKTKTSKLDKIDRSVSNLSRSRICEGPEVSADEPLPIHLRRYVMKPLKDPFDCNEGDRRLMDWRGGRVDRRYLSHRDLDGSMCFPHLSQICCLLRL